MDPKRELVLEQRPCVERLLLARFFEQSEPAKKELCLPAGVSLTYLFRRPTLVSTIDAVK